MRRFVLALLLLPFAANALAVYRGMSGGFQSESTGSLVMSAPSGTVSTDVLIATLTFSGGSNEAITPPSGWTLIVRQDNTTVHGVAAYWALGSAASHTWSFSPTSLLVGGYEFAYKGMNNTAPVDNSGGQANAASTTVTSPSINTIANPYLLGIYGWINTTGLQSVHYTNNWAPGGNPFDWFNGTARTVAMDVDHGNVVQLQGPTGTKSLTVDAVGSANTTVIMSLVPDNIPLTPTMPGGGRLVPTGRSQ